MLILFDIDGTMLLTKGAGITAMERAGRELFGDGFGFGSIETAGRLDGLIWADLADANGVEATDGNHARFRARYAQHLHGLLAVERIATALPGVAALIEALSSWPHAALGLLTGNYPETGRLKLVAAGYEPDGFRVAAWGTDGPNRRALPPVAMARHAEIAGSPIAAQRVVIIGDTPHDIDCAKHNACRSIGVSTGAFDRRRLADDGADLALDDLSDTQRVLDWLRSID